MIEFLIWYAAIVISWEFGKWFAKKVFWKKVEVKVPGGKMSMSVRRNSKLDPEKELDSFLTSSGMQKVN
jgi:hypothetical protein